MKISSKFVLILGIFYLSILSVVSYIWYSENQTLITAKSVQLKDNKTTFLKLIELKTDSLKAGIYDYTYWDEMLAFTKNNNPEWAEINLGELEKSYHFDYVLVYDAQLKLIYSTSGKTNTKKLEKSVDVSKLDLQHPVFLDYYIVVDGTPAKLFQAPIQSSKDSNRTEKPSGYLIGIKLFDKAFINDIEVSLHEDISLRSSNKGDIGDYSYPLLNSSKKEIDRIYITLNDSLYQTVNGVFIKIILSILVITFISLFGFAWLIKHNVLIPLHNLSIIDDLTKIHNRRYYNETVPKILDLAKRNNSLINYAMIDIDCFKQYNDNYGHQRGDNVLLLVAQCLKNSINRSDDYLFRLGGEEFLVVFKSDSREKAMVFVNKLLKNIELLKIIHEYSDAGQYITVSVGLVSKPANEIIDIDELYKESDDLLYKAKATGRNKVIINL